MVAVPPLTPVTIPEALIEATAALDVLQTPPDEPSLSVVEEPWQTVVVPVIVPAIANGLTVTPAVVTADPHAPLTVYVIVAMPPETPVTAPEPFTEAIVLLLLDQVPPETAS